MNITKALSLTKARALAAGLRTSPHWGADTSRDADLVRESYDLFLLSQGTHVRTM